MSETTFTALCAEIERLMYEHTPKHVITAVSAVLGEKGDHIMTNWQDEAMANRFVKASEKLVQVADLVK